MIERALEAINLHAELRKGLIQVELMSNIDDEGLACFSYSQNFDVDFVSKYLEPLATQMGAVGVIACARNQREFVGQDRLVQWHEVAGRRYPQIILENSFSQNNLTVCREMLEWAVDQTRVPRAGAHSQGDLLELCCGNGNFTLPLAGNFERVLAAERDKRAVQSTELCAEWSAIYNITCVRLKTEQIVEAFRGDRTFRRLRDKGIELDEYNFGTVLVNPPRAGLDTAALQLVDQFDRCLYISCSPQKLAKDLAKLPNHRVVAATMFDQFPYSCHAEVGVRLERRD